MQVRLSKLLVSSIRIATFTLFFVHTFHQSNGHNCTRKAAIQSTDYALKIIDDKELITKFKMPVKGERNIFFIDSTCTGNSTESKTENSKLILNGERACAIESTARSNPNASIYLFYSCPLEPESLGRSDRVVKRIFYYPNVYVWHQSMDSIFIGSPLEPLYSSGMIFLSKYSKINLGNALRILMLWTFGGIYLDLDFVVRRSFDPLGPNFAGAESRQYLNNAALGLASDGIGAQIAKECIDGLNTDFRGNIWGYNGAKLITRVMRKRCKVDRTQEMTLEACGGFNVLQEPVFYPIYFRQWRLFYDESSSRSTMAKLTEATAVHLWNSMKLLDLDKTRVALNRGSRQPIALLHQEFCPNVNQLVMEEAKMASASVVQIK